MADTPPVTITTSDLWAAARGLGMYRMTREELQSLMDHHAGDDRMFASKVIHEAARQVLATKGRG